MGKSCCAIDCKNRFSKSSQISFYRLPKATEKRTKWIAAIRRKDWNPDTEAWICASHFVSGKKSDDPLHPDYVPSIFSFTSTMDRCRAVRNLQKYLRSQDISDKRFAATALLNLHQACVSEVKVQPDEVLITKAQIEVPGTHVQTEETNKDIASLYEQNKSLNTECQSLRERIYSLEKDLKRCTLDPCLFDDKKMKFFTGLPNLEAFMVLFNSVSSVLPASGNHSLKPTQELLLTLMKLRFSLSEELLAYLFGIHQSTVSRILHRWKIETDNARQNIQTNNAKQNNKTDSQSEGHPSEDCIDVLCFENILHY